jgi:hypothetical protein
MEEYGLKCPICGTLLDSGEVTKYCPKHRFIWLQSAERGEIDWTSDESYETFNAIFIARIKDEEVYEPIPSRSTSEMQESDLDGSTVS